MTDNPWGKKPKRWKYGELRSTVIMTKDFGLYRASETDDFFEKLKAHYESIEEKLKAVKVAFENHRDNILELSGKLNTIAHELPEEYHFTIENIATKMISYGELRKILEGDQSMGGTLS